MKNIKEIYQDLIINSYYDENYGGNGALIDGKYHGVCIDFSRKMMEELIENGYIATIISTTKIENGQNILHAAVLYRDKDTNDILIADPVTDIREMTEKEMDDISREQAVERNNRNYKRNIQDYVDEFGAINIYNHEMSSCEQNVGTDELVRKHFFEMVGEKLGTLSDKKMEHCSTLTSISQVRNYADGPTWLACESLYKKGIDTYCSTFSPNYEIYNDDGSARIMHNYLCINGYFHSLSEENKKAILEARKSNPENYFINIARGMYGLLGMNEEIRDDRPMEFMIGFKELPENLTENELIQKMNDLTSIFTKQTYRHGVYTREQVLKNEHNKRRTSANFGVATLNSNNNDTSEQIAKNENLLYSERFDMFFENEQAKSRYIESIYCNDIGVDNEEEIAKQNGIVYSDDYKMFFEDAEELSKYTIKMQELQASENELEQSNFELPTGRFVEAMNLSNGEYKTTSTDLAEVSMKYRNWS